MKTALPSHGSQHANVSTPSPRSTLPQPRIATARLLVAACLACLALRAAPLELVGFTLGEQGSERNVAVSGELAANLGERALWQLTEAAPGRLTWNEALAPGKARLIVAEVRLGTRLELFALRLDESGVVRLAARRPAHSAFQVRRDRGIPGAEQGIENARVELAAELDVQHRRYPEGLSGEVAPVSVGSLRDDGDMGGSLPPTIRAGLEAMALAAVADLGRPARRIGDGGTFVLAARRHAVMVAIEWRTEGRSWRRDGVPQESLYPFLRFGIRKAATWGERVSDLTVISKTWEPVSILGVEGDIATLRTGAESFATVDLGGGTVTPLPEKADPVIPPPAWLKTIPGELGGGLTIVGDVAYAFTDDGRCHVVATGDGRITATHGLGRRVRGSGGTVIRNQLWVTDFDGNLLRIGLDTGAIAGETPIGDVLLAPPLVQQERVLIATRSNLAVLTDLQGNVTVREPLQSRLVGMVPVGDTGWLATETGVIYRWPASASEPELYADLAEPLNGEPVVGTAITRWGAPADDEGLGLTLTESVPHLLVTTRTGLLILVRLP